MAKQTYAIVDLDGTVIAISPDHRIAMKLRDRFGKGAGIYLAAFYPDRVTYPETVIYCQDGAVR